MTAEPLDRPDDHATPDAPEVGTVGTELALLLQALAERSSVAHPVVTLVREHPEMVEHATDTVVGWVRGAQHVLADAAHAAQETRR